MNGTKRLKRPLVDPKVYEVAEMFVAETVAARPIDADRRESYIWSVAAAMQDAAETECETIQENFTKEKE